MDMTVASFIADFFRKKNITDVFMVTGGGAMFLNDALSRNKAFITTCFHHEQACSMAAEAYFKVLNRPAIVNITTGPGGTNAITGVYGAFVDSSAMIVISGQVKTPTLKRYHSENLRQLGDQEIDIVPVVKTITKYAVLIDDPEVVEYELEKAFHLATTGRPGPVWIDVPIDIQSMIMPKQKKIYKIEDNHKSLQPLKKDVELFLKKLSSAKRPVIICGNGIHFSQTKDKLLKFATKYDIPITLSFSASDVIPYKHRLHIGKQGTIGDRAGNFAVQNSDLLIVLGSRLNIRQVSYDWSKFAPNAFKIMVDIDSEELNKPTLNIDLKINNDMKIFFETISKVESKININKKTDYLKWCQIRKEKYPVVLPAYYKAKKLNHYVFMKELSQCVKEKTVIVTADGAAAITSFQAFETKEGQRLFSNSGSAPMGFDLPAVIGASIAIKNKKKFNQRVLCFAGDGSIMMNLQELQTIKTIGRDITVFIINNGGYQSILQTQKNYFKDNIFGCIKSRELDFPKFKKIATSFGLEYHKVKSLKDLSQLKKILSSSGPNICEVFVDVNQGFEPKLVSKRTPDGKFVSPALDDMYPHLEPEEMLKNRI